MAWQESVDAERETIDEIVKAARDAMHAAGFDSRNPRFPFVMHHEFYRTKLRTTGCRPKHADVSLLLTRWARERASFAEAYAWQAVEGAAAFLGARSGRKVPDEVEAGCLEHCGPPLAFENWAKAALSPARKG